MARIDYDERYSYELFDDGYDIFDGGRKVVKQHYPYDKPFDKLKTHEENAIIQIEQMKTPVEPAPTDADVMRADMDYMALMLDVDLPSEKEV